MLDEMGPDELIREILKESDPERKSQYWQQLLPGIDHAASTVGSNKKFIRHELIDEAPAKIWEEIQKGNYRPEIGKFLPWMKQVLRNYTKDLCRKSSRRQQLKDSLNEGVRKSEQQAIVVPASGEEELTAKDLETLQAWPLKLRFHLCLICGDLWLKIPQKIRDEWTAELGIDGGFPPEEFFLLSDLGERNMIIASCLQVTRAALNKQKERNADRLLQLDYVRERLCQR